MFAVLIILLFQDLALQENGIIVTGKESCGSNQLSIPGYRTYWGKGTSITEREDDGCTNVTSFLFQDTGPIG